jgi:hypothetical protein
MFSASIQISAADGFAIAMLCVTFASMALLALLFLSMRIHVARRDPQVDALLEELENDEREEARLASPEPAPSQPWERDADWWK